MIWSSFILGACVSFIWYHNYLDGNIRCDGINLIKAEKIILEVSTRKVSVRCSARTDSGFSIGTFGYHGDQGPGGWGCPPERERGGGPSGSRSGRPVSGETLVAGLLAPNRWGTTWERVLEASVRSLLELSPMLFPIGRSLRVWCGNCTRWYPDY